MAEHTLNWIGLGLIHIILVFILRGFAWIAPVLPSSIIVPKARRIQWLNQMSAPCHTPFRRTVCCSRGSWVFLLTLCNEEGHCRKVAVGKTSGRNKLPRIKGLRVQPRGSSGCSSEQTNNSLDESLQFFSARSPHVLQDLKENGWSMERRKIKEGNKSDF